MQQIRTSIDIDAPVEKVWDVLTDFSAYPDWNPLITKIATKLEGGARVDFKIAMVGRSLPIKARMKRVVKHEDFRWRGPRSRLQGALFNGEHYFSVEKLDDERTRFVHGEDFRGALLPLLWWKLEPMIREGYRTMNEAVKRRAEAK